MLTTEGEVGSEEALPAQQEPLGTLSIVSMDRDNPPDESREKPIELCVIVGSERSSG